MKKIISITLSLLTLFLITSCETGEDTDYNEKPVLFCYASADSTIDSLYLSRTGGVNEPIEFSELGVSGADVSLFELPVDSTDYIKIGDLQEYGERPGVYYLPESDFPGGFTAGNLYRINVQISGFDNITAETQCPYELADIEVVNVENGNILQSIVEDPSAVDTIYYRRGDSYDDITLLACSFDSLSILFDNRAGGYKIVPDEICRTDTSFWLEDTTKKVWEDYDTTLQIFKRQDNFGTDLMNYFLRDMRIYWHDLYHEGMHTMIFRSTDEVFRMYLETRYSGEEVYSNVENGKGLFSLLNSSSEKSRYRVYVKSLEDKYP